MHGWRACANRNAQRLGFRAQDYRTIRRATRCTFAAGTISLTQPTRLQANSSASFWVRPSTVVAGLNSIGAAEFAKLHIQARGWCSIVQRNGHVPAQHFPGASWLAVYCVQAGEPDAGFKSAGVLRLYERRLGSIYRDASTWELKSPYRYGNHTWSPVPGWMALFPAHVPHEVSWFDQSLR